MIALVDVRPMTEAEKAELIATNLAHFFDGLHHADQLTLDHEAERAVYLQPSPLVLRMRAQINAERDLRRAHQLLTDLGGTADAMADRLRALGIRGVQHLSGLCPLAAYLETQSVTAYICAEYLAVPVTGDTAVEGLVPAAAGAFIKNFDRGVYLDLIDAELTDAALAGA